MYELIKDEELLLVILLEEFLQINELEYNN